MFGGGGDSALLHHHVTQTVAHGVIFIHEHTGDAVLIDSGQNLKLFGFIVKINREVGHLRAKIATKKKGKQNRRTLSV